LTFATGISETTTETDSHSHSGPAPRRRAHLRQAVILSGVLGLTAIAGLLGSGTTAQASAGLRYSRSYSVQGSWLCYGWPNGAYHCTQRWHRSDGRLVSDNPGWVPNVGGVATTRTTFSATVRHSSGVVQGNSGAGEPCRSNWYFNGTPSQWQVPPSCYGGVYAVNPAHYVYRSGFGWCNWWPEVLNPGRPNLLWGPYAHGSSPRVGATIKFAPGVQGAGGGGHWGTVVAIYPGGYWMLISEMNFTWRGAGWQRVNYRYVHVGAGVSFIY
jgi:hypothetical protein